MMPHTPGPWTMRKSGVILAESREARKAIGQFLGMASEQRHNDEHPANCKLIAAAPELLEALKSFDPGEVIHVTHPTHVACNICRARAAIAKAEGRS